MPSSNRRARWRAHYLQLHSHQVLVILVIWGRLSDHLDLDIIVIVINRIAVGK